jgi:hypothetical protein
VVLVNGRVAGVWTHRIERERVAVEIELFEKRLSAAQRNRIASEVDRLGRFLDRPAQVSYGVA